MIACDSGGLLGALSGHLLFKNSEVYHVCTSRDRGQAYMLHQLPRLWVGCDALGAFLSSTLAPLPVCD